MKYLAALFLVLLFAAAPAFAEEIAPELDTKARAAFDAGHYDEAIKLWGSAYKLDPKAAYLFHRGQAYERSGDADNAITDYGLAIKTDGSDAEYYEARAKLLADKAGTMSGDNGDADSVDKTDWDQAIADYTAAIEIRLKGVADPAAWLREKSKPDTKEYNLALEDACVGELIKLNPKDPALWLRRAEIDPSVGDPARELADDTQVIALDPKNAKAHLARASLYLDDPQDRQKALDDYTAAIAITPDDSIYLQRADLYAVMKQDDKAIADYNQALTLGAGEEAYAGLANLYAARGDWDKVLDIYGKVIAADPGSDTYHARAEIYYRKQDWDNVIADMNKAAEFDVKDAKAQADGDKENGVAGEPMKGDGVAPNTLVMRGDAEARKGQFDKALADFRHASANDPDAWPAADAEAWTLATCPDAKIRDGAKAVKLASDTCLSTGWEETSPIDTLAAAEAETGKWKEAVDHETQAIKAAKDDEQEARDDKRAEADEKQSRIDEDERRIKEYSARLALYQKKQPCRDCKEQEW
ncbi:MAG TPA: tetratricopeptide repeat protein [Chthoniobacteraceae bacterium]|nr:tetratricopeptide repeat protein [Chthoniobacteraceae bacterium]